MSRNGANIFSGKVDLDSNQVEMSDADVLFAGFISAILSVSEELQNSDIRELGYQDNKIIFTLTDNLIFLGFVDTRVPNKDIERLLDEIIRRWMNKYNDDEYPYIPNDMREGILDLVQESIRDVFWWASPTYSLRNNFKYITSTISEPSGSYFIQYLPNPYLFTSLGVLLLIILGSYFTGVAFIGFSSGTPSGGGYYNIRLATALTISMITIGTGIVLKIFYRDQFNLRAFTMISMIYSIFLFGVIIFTTNFWLSDVYGVALNAVNQNLLLSYSVQMFVYTAPFNTAFFGYIIFTGYATSNNQNIPTKQYLGAYLIALLFIFSITEFISTALIGVVF